MLSRNGLRDPQAAAVVDIATTYTNRFAERANAELDNVK
jgi:hypothetical protein